MTTLIPPEKQTKFILVGATGKLGRSISSHNANVTYGICSKDNPLLGEIISGIQEPLISSLSDVSLEIYNVIGQRGRTLVQGTQEPGRYQIIWNATNDFGQALSSGMYIYRIQAGDFVSVKKLILMK